MNQARGGAGLQPTFTSSPSVRRGARSVCCNPTPLPAHHDVIVVAPLAAALHVLLARAGHDVWS